MTGMVFKGVEPRVTEAKNALNRLRWEISQLAASDPGKLPMALQGLSELVGIYEAIATDLDKMAPEGTPLREQISNIVGANLDFYRIYHKGALR